MTEKTEQQDPVFEILFTQEEIEERVLGLAQEISKDYELDNKTPLLLIGVLKGAVPFLTDLSQQINHPNLYIDYMGVSSYNGNTTSNKEPKITLDTKIPIKGKNVIIVEDIVDTGYSIATLIDILQARKPKSLKVCALLSKPERREIEVPIDYLGFTIPNLWVQGYGLDTNEEGRYWPYIACRKE
jgi:hypoxanthine phosphoribosyltransferase